MSRIQIIGAGGSGVLDPFATDLWSACGLNRLLGSYAGPLIRVRRTSDDAEQDIGSLPSSALDVAAMLTFVGGGDAYVSRFYDQSGLGNDYASPSNAEQPQIVASGSASDRAEWNTGATTTSVVSVNQQPGTTAGTGLTFMYNYIMRSTADDAAMMFTGNLGIAGHNSYGIQLQATDFFFVAYYFNGVPVTGNYDRVSFPSVTTFNEETDIVPHFPSDPGHRPFAMSRNGVDQSALVNQSNPADLGATSEYVYVGNSGGNSLERMAGAFGFFIVWSTSTGFTTDTQRNAASSITLVV